MAMSYTISQQEMSKKSLKSQTGRNQTLSTSDFLLVTKATERSK